MKKGKVFAVYTVEHRKYAVRAQNQKEANEYISEWANLEPKDKKVKLLDFGDFKVLDGF